jgi:hypothetical protein
MPGKPESVSFRLPQGLQVSQTAGLAADLPA